MNTIETPINKEKVAALVADAFQDSEYFLPKIALQDQLGLDVEVISLKRDPIEIYSNFSRIELLDVSKTIQKADPRDYIGVLIPGGARSPALLAENQEVLSFFRQINDQKKLVTSICRGSLLVAKSGIATGRHLTGFHLDKEFPDPSSARSSKPAVGFGAMTVPSSSMEILCPRGTRTISSISSEAFEVGCHSRVIRKPTSNRESHK